MIINWLANRVATALKRTERDEIRAALEQIRAERESGAREARGLIIELESVLEKTQAMFARLAMRRTREIRKAAEQVEPAEEAMREVATAPAAPMSVKERKSLLRQRLMSGRVPRASGDEA